MRQAQEISNTNNLFDSRFSKIPFYGKWKMDESLNSIKLAESFFRNPNYQTVVFKDKQDTLVPITVDFAREMEDDTKYRNMIEVMKSTDYEYLGLYPILDL